MFESQLQEMRTLGLETPCSTQSGFELQFPTRGSNIGIGTQSSLGFDSGSEFKHRVPKQRTLAATKFPYPIVLAATEN